MITTGTTSFLLFTPINIDFRLNEADNLSIKEGVHMANVIGGCLIVFLFVYGILYLINDETFVANSKRSFYLAPFYCALWCNERIIGNENKGQMIWTFICFILFPLSYPVGLILLWRFTKNR